MQAADVMTRRVVTIGPDAPLDEVAATLLEHSISGMPVVDGDAAIGMITEGDLLRHVSRGTGQSWWRRLVSNSTKDFVHNYGTRVRDVMTSPAISVENETPLSQIASVLERHAIKRVPVVSQGKLVGIVSRGDILRGLAASKADEAITSRPSDREIRNHVETLIEENTSVSMQAVSVVVWDGDVFLWGVVDNASDKEAIRVAAENVAGIGHVHDYTNSLSEVRRLLAEDKDE